MSLQILPIPNEIISEILSNLGKNDLLVCRLVSQSWNGLSLKILRNPEYEHNHELTQDNIQKFIEYSNEREEEWLLPFHFIFKRDWRLWNAESVEYDQIPNYIQQLQTKFGEKCIVGLTLSHDSSSSSSSSLECVKVLMSILTLIAPSLTHLDLSEFKIRYEEEDEGEDKVKVKEMLGKTQLNFLNLSKLKSCPSPTFWNPEYRLYCNATNDLHSFLIKNSQNLKEVEVISPYDLDEIEEIGDLRKLKIVEALEDIEAIIEPLRPGPISVLKDLSLTCPIRMRALDHHVLHEFLYLFSTALEGLTVRFQEIPTNPFPRLSHLRFLRIHVQTPTKARIHVDPEKLNLSSEAFPVLESMDISTNVHFESTDTDSGKLEDEWILRTVKFLKIRVMDSPFNAWEVEKIEHEDEYEYAEIISRASAKEYVDHLQELFPNVTSLTLLNESDGHEEYLNQLLIAFIQSDGAPKIQNLEIQDCEKNYMGYILNGLVPGREPLIIIKNMNFDEEYLKAIKKTFEVFSDGIELSVEKQTEYMGDVVHSRVITCKAPIMHLKMTGLEKICLSLLKNINHRSRQSGSEQKDLFLMSLPMNLPLLKQIDISQQMFGQDKEFCKQQIINVREKFPDLIINTTR